MPAKLNLSTEGRQLAELLDERANIVAAAEAISKEAEGDDENGWTEDRETEFDKLQVAYDDFTARITGLQKVAGRGEFLNNARKSLNDPIPAKSRGDLGGGSTRKAGEFACLGERLVAIAGHYITGRTDPRLVAALGMNEGVQSEGGFLVSGDEASDFMTNAYGNGLLLSRMSSVPLTKGNTLKVRVIDETSRADGSRAGGVQAYWAHEAASVTAKKPKLRTDSLELDKIFAVGYVTEELLEDATALEAELLPVFQEEITFKLEDSVVNGATGGGGPLGILNSPAKITVSAETGQTSANPLVYENIVKMWARMLPQSQARAVWLVDLSLIPDLFSTALVHGTSGTPVYLPPGGVSGSPFGTILGRPVLHTEYTQVKNTEGDICLFDPGDYRLINKGGVRANQSMHVAFLTDEMTFKWTYRVNGAPKKKAAITPKNGGDTLSSIVTLATRT